jgi:tetratricopeptide (TPR) repeat protein
MNEKFVYAFKDDPNILAVFLVNPLTSKDTHVFHVFLRREDFPPSAGLLETALKPAFNHPFKVDLMTGRSYDEKHDVFFRGELVYASAPDQVSELVDKTIKSHYGVKNAHEVDLKEKEKWRRMDRHAGDMLDIPKYIVFFAMMGITGWIMVMFYFGLAIGLLVFLLLLAFSLGAFLLARRYTDKFADWFYLGGKEKEDVYSRARSLRLNNKYWEAVELYNNAIAQKPLDPEPHFQLAETYEEMKMYQQAVIEFERTLPKLKDAHRKAITLHHIALILLEDLKEVPRAEQLLARVMEEYPGTEGAERAKNLLENYKESDNK